MASPLPTYGAHLTIPCFLVTCLAPVASAFVFKMSASFVVHVTYHSTLGWVCGSEYADLLFRIAFRTAVGNTPS